MLRLFIHLFLGGEMRHEPGSLGRNQRWVRNQLLPLPLPKTSCVEEHVRKKEDKRGLVAPQAKTSRDGAGSILSWALTRSHHCLQHKIGSCHATKWATSCAIRPRSVIDDQKWNMKEGSKEMEKSDKQNHSKLVHTLGYSCMERKWIRTLRTELSGCYYSNKA